MDHRDEVFDDTTKDLDFVPTSNTSASIPGSRKRPHRDVRPPCPFWKAKPIDEVGTPPPRKRQRKGPSNAELKALLAESKAETASWKHRHDKKARKVEKLWDINRELIMERDGLAEEKRILALTQAAIAPPPPPAPPVAATVTTEKQTRPPQDSPPQTKAPKPRATDKVTWCINGSDITVTKKRGRGHGNRRQSIEFKGVCFSERDWVRVNDQVLSVGRIEGIEASPSIGVRFYLRWALHLSELSPRLLADHSRLFPPALVVATNTTTNDPERELVFSPHANFMNLSSILGKVSVLPFDGFQTVAAANVDYSATDLYFVRSIEKSGEIQKADFHALFQK